MHIMEIKSYSNQWAAEITDLFYQSVHAIDPSVYTPEQKEAWAPTPPDYAAWSKRLDEKRPLVAIINGQVAGFIELDTDGHIDCTYTHPNFQGMGSRLHFMSTYLRKQDSTISNVYMLKHHLLLSRSSSIADSRR